MAQESCWVSPDPCRKMDPTLMVQTTAALPCQEALRRMDFHGKIQITFTRLPLSLSLGPFPFTPAHLSSVSHPSLSPCTPQGPFPDGGACAGGNLSVSDQSWGTTDPSVPRGRPGMPPGALQRGLCSRAGGAGAGTAQGAGDGAVALQGAKSWAQPTLGSCRSPQSCQTLKGCCHPVPCQAEMAPGRPGWEGAPALPPGAAWLCPLRNHNSQSCPSPAQGKS